MKKRVLILGAPIFQKPVVKKAKAMGLYVGIADINPDAPAFDEADEVFVASIRDKEKMLSIAKEFKPDGIVIGACDTSVVTGAYLCQQLGLPGYDEEVAIKATNKVEMLQAFETSHVAHPLFQVIKKKDVGNIKLDIPYPVISKPTDSAGGRGIYFITSEKDLYKGVQFSSQAGLSGDVLIEEYMDGPEVSVEILVVDGVAHVLQVTDKLTSGEPHFFEIGHAQPSALPQSVKSQIRSIAAHAALSLGLVNSAAHAEVKLTKDGPKMVEIGARLGGDWITSYLIDTSLSGICMTQAAIEMAMGEKIEIKEYHNSDTAVAVRFIPAQEGTVKDIRGIEQAKAIDGIIKVEVTAVPGKRYVQATDDSERFGYVIAKGCTTEEALANCNSAMNAISILME